jgi:antirestriction protein ArdC
MTDRKHIAQEITDSIIAELEQGVAPWVKPWNSKLENNGQPFNPVTKTIYKGINYFWLSMLQGSKYGTSNQWLTYKGAQDIGAQVTKEAKGKGVQVIFYKPLEITGALNPETGKNDSKVIPMLKTYTVFNADFIEGLPVTEPGTVETVQFDPILNAEHFIVDTGAHIKHGNSSAFYSPDLDFIALPNPEDFKTREDYYATALHELGHWSGSEKRLNRQFGKRFGDSAYAFEELVAELTAAMLCAHIGINGKLQHSNYIASWLKILKTDNKAILKASASAQKAMDYLTGLQFEKQNNQPLAA